MDIIESGLPNKCGHFISVVLL